MDPPGRAAQALPAPPWVEVIRVRRGLKVISSARVRSVLRAAAADPELGARLAQISSGRRVGLAVRITSDRELRQLNQRFLGEDHATDVLSFYSGTASEEGFHLGDLALSWPSVQRQAREFGHPEDAEATLLLVHGLLHLGGWDHADGAGERAMINITWRCLAGLGVELGPERLGRSRP